MACTCPNIPAKVKGNLLYQVFSIIKEGTQCLWISEATDSLFGFITPTHLPGKLKVCSLLGLLLFLSGLQKRENSAISLDYCINCSTTWAIGYCKSNYVRNDGSR